MLISGLTFAALLMTEQAAIFCGIMQWSGSRLDNVGAPIWVVDPMVEQVNDTEARRDTDLSRVRSVEGVAWASPFYQGMLRTRMSFTGNPYLFTTYDHAVQYAPSTRKMLSCVLAAAQPGEDSAKVARRISEATGLKAYTKHEFFWVTVWWYIKNTGIPVAFRATVLLGFIVGLAISSQPFYSFVLENLRNLGALKAMGASDGVLARMVMVQTFTVGMIGYGCGVGLATVFGVLVLKKGMPPFFMPWQLPVLTLVAILFICWLAASLGIRKIRHLEPAVVFRG